MKNALLKGILLAMMLFLSACATNMKDSGSTALIYLEAAVEIINPY